ncbi:MAG TPA: DJ-1/PfpI family protein [Devosia sp.]|uniref:GlxA family transcriptional regulator n=1 Tax=Devosia sp. TaxID=1871048 RepID=UPI002DDD5A01|nr:DJ-1/PfpI family protein [Devosia sp.]HEV2518443.1 DJ-1/PfpI family protein [Devosia sp.]
MPERLIVMLTYAGVNAIDVCGPLQAFATADRQRLPAAPHYRLVTASAEGGPVETAPGFAVVTRSLAEIDPREIDTLIVPGGVREFPPSLDGLLDWLRAHGGSVPRLCSVCTGAFFLAQAGLLNGRRVTTHWSGSDELGARFPGLSVEPDCIYVNDGRVWTSGGVSAGIDLALALIEADVGPAVALAAARQMVVFRRRPGGQSQFSPPAQPRGGPFDGLHAWMAENLCADLRVERLAERAGMSARNFARVYVEETGATPARAVEALRLAAACRALENTGLPLKVIAEQAGLSTEQNLRRVIQRQFGIGPSDYRIRFGQGEPVA